MTAGLGEDQRHPHPDGQAVGRGRLGDNPVALADALPVLT